VESRLPELLSESPLRRLHAAQELLCELADADAMTLATEAAVRPQSSGEFGQLARVLDLLHERFAESIHIEDLCAVANLSARSLHRLFLRHLGENVSDYLGRLRIGRACMLLVETDRPISVIAAETGFSNLSNFNRRFRVARQMTPKEFRRFVVKNGRMPNSRPQPDLTKRSPSLEARTKRPVSAPESRSDPASGQGRGQRSAPRFPAGVMLSAT
jgi:AraC-like DNA-binding protein